MHRTRLRRAAELFVSRRKAVCTIRVGGEECEFLAITILGRSHPEARDRWDGNWVRASVEMAVGGFRGQVGGDLRAEELISFHREVARLAASVAGEARFTTMEDWLSIVVTGDRRGHVELMCRVCDQPGVGNMLEFRLSLDQTYLRPMVDQVGRAVAEFPEIDEQGG
jgi:hypothetical protein